MLGLCSAVTVSQSLHGMNTEHMCSPPLQPTLINPSLATTPHLQESQRWRIHHTTHLHTSIIISELPLHITPVGEAFYFLVCWNHWTTCFQGQKQHYCLSTLRTVTKIQTEWLPKARVYKRLFTMVGLSLPEDTKVTHIYRCNQLYVNVLKYTLKACAGYHLYKFQGPAGPPSA